MIDHSHNWPVELRTYFQTFCAFVVNFNTVLGRESNSVTSFSFSGSILFVDWSQSVRI